MKYEDYVLMNNHEVAINGVKIAAKILNITVPHYSFFDPSEISNKEITECMFLNQMRYCLMMNG